MNRMRSSVVYFFLKKVHQSHLTMGSLTKTLVTNASEQLFIDKTLSCSTELLSEQLNLEGQSEAATSEISYSSMYLNDRKEKIMFFWQKLLITPKIYYLEPGLYPSIRDIVKAMKTLIPERHIHRENCITDKVSRRTPKIGIHLADEKSGLALIHKDLDHIFWSIIGNQHGLILRGKGHHEPEIAHDLVRIPSLWIYTDLIEPIIVSETKVPLLPGLPFISKLRTGDVRATGQYMNYQTSSNLKIGPLRKICF